MRACCDQTHNKRLADQVYKDSCKLLTNLIDGLISSCALLLKNDPHQDLPRLSLVLMFTYIINLKILQPIAQGVNDLYDRFCYELQKASTDKAVLNFSLKLVCDAIKKASSTSDLIQIVQYLLCPSTDTDSERFEPLAVIKTSPGRHKRIEVVILTDEDVTALPTFSLPVSRLPTKHEQYCIKVTPLSLKQHHSFKLP